jgi:hypothetical protein
MRRDSFWFPFEPNRWLSNEKLSLVSLEAKGLWIHLVCLIYKANAGGRLVINGNPPTPEQISRMVGQDAKPLLQELEVAGVYEIKDGAIFHGGTAATLADMNKRSAGYASRITHRCPKDEPSMDHLSPIDEQKMGHNNNNNNNNIKKEREGLRPTLSQWLTNAKEIGWSEADAETAFFYYGSVGWMIGNKPMKNWKLCARTCQRRNQNQKKGGDLMSISSLEFDGMKKVKYENNCNNSK